MIRCEHVSKQFGAVRALSDVSLHIAPGERVAFVGSNGSGKTTLLRSIVGLVRVGGRVTIDGIDVALTPEQALARVAYIPQIAPPLDAPVREVVRAFAALRGKTPDDVAGYAQRLGVELAKVAHTRFRDLSGGTKQKILAAMALAAQAQVLVCDEPTANLDAAARKAFFAEVDQRPPDAILVLCSHRIEEVRQLVDRAVLLRDGRLVSDGHVEDQLAVGEVLDA